MAKKSKGRKASEGRRPNQPVVSPNLVKTIVSEDPPTLTQTFSQLESLCKQVGYVHALTALVFRDNVITFGEELSKEDYSKIYHPGRLIRTEIAVLVGLWLRGDRSIEHPGAEKVMAMMEESDRLLHEMHAAMLAPAHRDFMAAFHAGATEEILGSPLGAASAMQEAIFYAAESAFPYQYTSLARARYKNDREWLVRNAGFSIDEAATFMEELVEWLGQNLQERLQSLRGSDPNYWTFLDVFCFTLEDVAAFSSIEISKVKKIIDRFSVPDGTNNDDFNTVFSRNHAAIFPFVKISDRRIIFLLEYVGSEAIYSSPAYWMREDNHYLPTASEHRGKFAEDEAVRLFGRAFQPTRILKNVVFRRSKKSIAGELDVLIVHGRRAFMIQIKSKGLTEAAKAGNKLQIDKDFEAAIQKAYDQAVECVEFAKAKMDVEIDGKIVNEDLFANIDEFYPICISSENYPSLSFQVYQFLRQREVAGLMPPIVIDLFTLDVITEFLRSPLYLSDYLCKRSKLFGKLIASHELNIFGMHLRNNLYVESDVSLMMIQDDFVLEIDMALGARRKGLPWTDTPAGLLTRDLDNPLGRILQMANASDRADVHQLGEFLLGLSSEAWVNTNRWIKRAIREALRDGANHDVTVPISEENVGLTVHCNDLEDEEAHRKLLGHVELRKYIHKAERWFGVCIEPVSAQVRFALGRLGTWEFNPALDDEAKSLRVKSVPRWVGPGNQRKKVGRNSLCPCGSGIKYKRCCLQHH